MNDPPIMKSAKYSSNFAGHFDCGGSRSALKDRWYAEGYFGTETLADAMSKGVMQNAPARMVICSRSKPTDVSLPELHDQSRRIAGALYSLGIRQGDVIAIQVPNWLEGMLAYQAAMLLGAVILPIIHIYGPTETNHILRESRAKAFIVPDRWGKVDYAERLRSTPHLPDLSHMIVIGEDGPQGSISWKKLTDLETPELPRVAADPDDLAVLLFTSGTTADPKGVLHSHNSILAEVDTLRASLGIEGQSISLSPWPSGHIAGVLNILNLYILGTSSILMDAWDAELAAILIEQYKVTTTSGSPFVLSALLDTVDILQSDISSLQSYMVGGANVPPVVVERSEKYGFAAYRCYGSTEHPTISTSAPDDPLPLRAQTDGAPTPGTRIRIVDDDGADVPDGVDGEIVTQGPEQFMGYHDDALNGDAFLPGGWFKTGDMGRFGEGGLLTITDRKKDIIIRGGENISSKEVEDILVRHPAVAEAAVIAMPDPRLGERVCAFIVPREGHGFTLDDADQHFRSAGVARQKTPERIVLIENLPRTASGKVRKFELRERLD